MTNLSHYKCGEDLEAAIVFVLAYEFLGIIYGSEGFLPCLSEWVPHACVIGEIDSDLTKERRDFSTNKVHEPHNSVANIHVVSMTVTGIIYHFLMTYHGYRFSNAKERKLSMWKNGVTVNRKTVSTKLILKFLNGASRLPYMESLNAVSHFMHWRRTR